MRTPVWTIERELCLLGDADSVGGALVSLGLASLVPVHRIVTVHDWWPAGAETYCYVFTLVGEQAERTLILKSFVPTPGTYSVAEALATSLDRSRQLSTCGVRAPAVYGAKNGTALFDYIEHSLVDFLGNRTTTSPLRRELISKALKIIESVHCAGYRPVDIVRDLRTNGREVFMVDFGWDLGARIHGSPSLDASLSAATDLLNRAGTVTASG